MMMLALQRLLLVMLQLLPSAVAWTPMNLSSESRPLHIRRKVSVVNPTAACGVQLRLARDKDVNDFLDFPDFSEEPPRKKLGIDIGSMLQPLSEREAAEMKAEATEVVNDAVAAGIDEIERLRAQLRKEVDETRAQANRQSELMAQRESERLLQKIDALTSDLLSSTAQERAATKLASLADRATEGQGVEWGSWGNLGGGAAVVSVLGSVDTFKTSFAEQGEATVASTNRIVVLADTTSDPYAKQLVPALSESLKLILSNNLDVIVYKPTATVPLGGDQAQCVVIFCTSYTDVSSIRQALDRLLRKTILPDGAVACPPTQIIAVSTVGTERTNKMPYSMQNLLGGKLDQRRQMEEAIVRTVKDRTVTPALDYTICKLGELKATTEAFQFAAGDVVDGSLAVETAVAVLTQAIALQPAARNSTLSCAGQLAMTSEKEQQEVLDDAFLRMDGPELLRIELGDLSQYFDELAEYIREWAELLAESGKGLTTPVSAYFAGPQTDIPASVQRAAAVRLLYLPTATGKRYMSKKEEDERIRDSNVASSSPGAPVVVSMSNANAAKEGGVEFMVEIEEVSSALRVRAKRCNYGEGSVVKELTEETVLSRFRKCINVWKSDHLGSQQGPTQ